MRAIILAGGYATRLWPFTKDVAKPLLPLGRKRIIEYLIEELIDCGDIEAIYVSTNYYYDPQFRRWLSEKRYKKVELHIEETIREEEKLGAIGALSRLFKNLPRDDYLVLAGDNYSSMNIRDFIDFFKKKNAFIVAAFDIGDLSRAKRYGIIKINDDNRVIDFVEKPAKPESTLAATAYYIVPENVIDMYHKYVSLGHNRDAPGRFIEWYHKIGAVYAYVFTGFWFDIGKPDTYLEAFRFVLRDSYVHESVELKSSEIIDPVIIEKGAKITNSVIGPYVHVHRDTEIENSRISNSIILGETIIRDSIVKDSLISYKVRLDGIEITNSNIGGYTKLHGV